MNIRRMRWEYTTSLYYLCHSLFINIIIIIIILQVNGIVGLVRVNGFGVGLHVKWTVEQFDSLFVQSSLQYQVELVHVHWRQRTIHHYWLSLSPSPSSSSSRIYMRGWEKNTFNEKPTLFAFIFSAFIPWADDHEEMYTLDNCHIHLTSSNLLIQNLHYIFDRTKENRAYFHRKPRNK